METPMTEFKPDKKLWAAMMRDNILFPSELNKLTKDIEHEVWIGGIIEDIVPLPVSKARASDIAALIFINDGYISEGVGCYQLVYSKFAELLKAGTPIKARCVVQRFRSPDDGESHMCNALWFAPLIITPKDNKTEGEQQS